jgi:ferrochelatase
MKRTAAVLLLAHGAVERAEDVEPYLQNVLGHAVAPPLLAQVQERYRRMGGRSPLLEITRAQAQGLERLLNEQNPEVTFVAREGFRFWKPSIAQTLDELLGTGPEVVVAVALNPYFSRLGTGRYFAALDEALKGAASPPEILRIESWHNHPFLIEAFAGALETAIASLPFERRLTADVVFSAHSIPRRLAEEGDPYPRQVEETVRRVAQRVGLRQWRSAWQSKGAADEPWLGPEAESVLDALARSGSCDVVLHPIGFIADHMETLYDDDILLKNLAQSLGLYYTRVPSLNAGLPLLRTLAAVIGHKLEFCT